MGFSISKAFKKVTKPFKSVAKRIKKAGSKLMGSIMKLPGFKQLGQLYAKTFGKLGPLGMIAASFLLPGLGSMIATGWGNLAGSLAANNAAGTFLHAIGTGMQTISSTLSGIGTSITDKINGVMDNAKGMFKEASDWVTGGKNPADFTVSGAKGLTRTQSFARPSGFGIPEQPFDIGQVTQRDLAVFDIDNLPRVQSAASPDSSLLLGQTPKIGVDTTFSGTEGLTRLQSTAAPGTQVAAGESFAKKALKAGAALLAPDATALSAPEFAVTLPSIGDDFLTQRFGAGGSGAVGGQFLTPQQQAFFAQHAKLLGQAG